MQRISRLETDAKARKAQLDVAEVDARAKDAQILELEARLAAKDLNVGDDVTDLFSHIQRYKPHQIELDTRLKPFIMVFIPTIGQIDAFLKVPRPDNATHIMQLGLGMLDEPSMAQSNPSVMKPHCAKATVTIEQRSDGTFALAILLA